ncbi:hypothetical protein JB92DRAFT_364973 [Gautieria morchelliformis]|nr:hypothetical protein JB92DRAFT_364973 [Gautieria morchelliformis]
MCALVSACAAALHLCAEVSTVGLERLPWAAAMPASEWVATVCGQTATRQAHRCGSQQGSQKATGMDDAALSGRGGGSGARGGSSRPGRGRGGLARGYAGGSENESRRVRRDRVRQSRSCSRASGGSPAEWSDSVRWRGYELVMRRNPGGGARLVTVVVQPRKQWEIMSADPQESQGQGKTHIFPSPRGTDARHCRFLPVEVAVVATPSPRSPSIPAPVSTPLTTSVPLPLPEAPPAAVSHMPPPPTTLNAPLQPRSTVSQRVVHAAQRRVDLAMECRGRAGMSKVLQVGGDRGAPRCVRRGEE